MTTKHRRRESKKPRRSVLANSRMALARANSRTSTQCKSSASSKSNVKRRTPGRRKSGSFEFHVQYPACNLANASIQLYLIHEVLLSVPHLLDSHTSERCGGPSVVNFFGIPLVPIRVVVTLPLRH